SLGVGLGHDFLRHIERTKVLIHIVDAASTEGRDPIEDIHTINKELKDYDESLAERIQVIAANKIDAIYVSEGQEDPVERIKNEFEKNGVKVFPISAVTGEGIKELLYCVRGLLDEISDKPVVFEQEYTITRSGINDEPYTVEFDVKDNVYRVEGPKIEKMLGYTNIDSEKGFTFFQNFMKDNGIFDELRELGIKDGDTVYVYGHAFEFYD
ncbi:MAG: Obg family GTPase CgtA, partial [Lachnospiraceae bacterium]|nr:Obg family GTPase CgtA [Lachnospiraceae bacterium]